MSFDAAQSQVRIQVCPLALALPPGPGPVRTPAPSPLSNSRPHQRFIRIADCRIAVRDLRGCREARRRPPGGSVLFCSPTSRQEAGLGWGRALSPALVQTPSHHRCPQGQRGKGNTHYRHPLGCARARMMHFGASAPGAEGEGQAQQWGDGMPGGPLFPGTASVPATRPAHPSCRSSSVLLVKALSSGGTQEMIHSLSPPIYAKARY